MHTTAIEHGSVKSESFICWYKQQRMVVEVSQVFCRCMVVVHSHQTILRFMQTCHFRTLTYFLNLAEGSDMEVESML